MRRHINKRDLLIQALIKHNNFGFCEIILGDVQKDPVWFKEICEKISENDIDIFASEMSGEISLSALKKWQMSIPEVELIQINEINTIYKQNPADLNLLINVQKIFSDPSLKPEVAAELFNKLIDVYMREHKVELQDIRFAFLQKNAIKYPFLNMLEYIHKSEKLDVRNKIILHFKDILLKDPNSKNVFKNILTGLPLYEFDSDTLKLLDVIFAADVKCSLSFISDCISSNKYEIISYVINNHFDKFPICTEYRPSLHKSFISILFDFNNSNNLANLLKFIHDLLNQKSSEQKFPFLPYLLKEAISQLMVIADRDSDLRATQTAIKVDYCLNLIELLLSYNKKLAYHHIDLPCLLAVRDRFLSDYNRIGEIFKKHNIHIDEVDQGIKDKVSELSQYDNASLIELFKNYHILNQFLVAPENNLFLTIKSKEINAVLNESDLIVHIKKNANQTLFDGMPDIYIYYSNDEKCYISLLLNQEHRFYEVNVISLNQLLSSEIIFTKFLPWEQIRGVKASKSTYGDNPWKDLRIYGREIEEMYSTVIRQRVKEQFANTLNSVKTKYIRIFEVGSGFGQAGILCADYAVSQDHIATLYPSDIHTENINKIPDKKEEPGYNIVRDITRSDNIEFYLRKMNDDLLNNEDLRKDTTCILISSGCLCFGIIPGSVTDDLELIQKLNHYGIDYVIADGLENTLINTTITKDCFDVMYFSSHHSPIDYDYNAGFVECSAKLTSVMKSKKLQLPEIADFNGLKTLNLSCDANPVNKLMRIVNGEKKYSNIDVLDLRFAYVEKSQLGTLHLLIEKLMVNNKLSHVIFSKSLCDDIKKKNFDFNESGKVRIIHDVAESKMPGQDMIEDTLENKLAIATAAPLSITPYQKILSKQNKIQARSTMFEPASASAPISNEKVSAKKGDDSAVITPKQNT